MGLDLNRWLKYAKARLDAAVGSGNKRLDELEAQREADLADKPWLREAGDGVVPTMDQVRARIDWEAERQRVDGAGGVPDRPEAPAGPDADAPAPAPVAPDRPTAEDPGRAAPAAPADTSSTPASGGGAAAPRSPQEQTEDAEREMARLELEARQRASADRLEQIRRELGAASPTSDDAAAGDDADEATDDPGEPDADGPDRDGPDRDGA